MKTNQAVKQMFKEAIALAKQEGLDLTMDSLTYAFTYPEEHPGVLVTIKIGGLFLDDTIEHEEEGNLQ